MNGIGVGFIRNPMGASGLARFNYSQVCNDAAQPVSANQQREDMLNLGQNHLPFVGAGCNVCTALVTTLHRNDSRHGQVEKTVECYTMGHLTKSVRPGAVRTASTANGSVPNVAWRNPDGGKVLIAYNDTGGSQALKVNWGGTPSGLAGPSVADGTRLQIWTCFACADQGWALPA